MNTTVEIRPHPQGGLTLAVPIPGTLTAREYVGRYEGAREARAGLTFMEDVYLRRRKWTRTDTARWFTDHAAALHRAGFTLGEGSKQLGYYVKDHAPRVFRHAHEVLASAATDEARETLLPSEVLP